MVRERVGHEGQRVAHAALADVVRGAVADHALDRDDAEVAPQVRRAGAPEHVEVRALGVDLQDVVAAREQRRVDEAEERRQRDHGHVDGRAARVARGAVLRARRERRPARGRAAHVERRDAVRRAGGDGHDVAPPPRVLGQPPPVALEPADVLDEGLERDDGDGRVAEHAALERARGALERERRLRADVEDERRHVRREADHASLRRVDAPARVVLQVLLHSRRDERERRGQDEPHEVCARVALGP